MLHKKRDVSRVILHGKNSFAEISKNNLARYRSENNYVGSLSTMSNMLKKILILATNLNLSYNYFDSLLKLFSDLYLNF